MKLVLLFFCCFLILIFLLLLLIVFSSIKLNIKKFDILYVKNENKAEKTNKEILAYLELYLLGIIKIAKVKITKERLKKLKIKGDFKQIKKDIKFVRVNHIVKLLKKVKGKVEKANINIKIGTDSIMLTAYLVAAVASAIGIAFGATNAKNSTFSVMPLYNSGNYIKINLNCIISVKIVHIIYAIYILLKRRRKNNGRTSNRRSYDYSYE